MIMFLCLRWWYGAGWQWIWKSVLVERLIWVNEVFSTKDLLKTLFAPYRQTYAGKIKGSLGDQLRAFADRSISRVIGAVVRLGLVFMAIIGSGLVTLVALITLIIWPFLPLMPAASIVLAVMGAGL